MKNSIIILLIIISVVRSYAQKGRDSSNYYLCLSWSTDLGLPNSGLNFNDTKNYSQYKNISVSNGFNIGFALYKPTKYNRLHLFPIDISYGRYYGKSDSIMHVIPISIGAYYNLFKIWRFDIGMDAHIGVAYTNMNVSSPINNNFLFEYDAGIVLNYDKLFQIPLVYKQIGGFKFITIQLDILLPIARIHKLKK